MNTLYYGDNLDILRGGRPEVTPIPDESVDLIYLDPPFNSQRDYNVLFKQHKGLESPAQIMAFEDTWKWSESAYREFCGDKRNERLWKLVSSLHDVLGDSEMMAYIVMMAPRLLELHRKLKPTGSLYLHCDPVASHYLKIVLDVVFGAPHFGNEIVWQRTNAKGLAFTRFARNHDVLLRYTRSDQWTWNGIYVQHDQHYVRNFYRYVETETGRRYRLDNLANPNHDRPNLTYEFLGVTRVWRWTKERMEKAYADGLVVQSKPGAVPCLKRYLDEQEGTPVGDVWTDIRPVQTHAKERRGYPTQKPLALLERIITASSNEGDIVMDPFAGCGTAIVAAERMNRRWIGIDITYLAINEVVDRLATEHVQGKEPQYRLEGTPKDMLGAQALFESTKAQNHKPFEQWAVSLVKGRWNDKKGADRGVDGRIALWLGDKYHDALIQVKGGKCTLSQVRDFANVIETEKAVLGILLTMSQPTQEMKRVAEKLGLADWPTDRKYPRYQILCIEDVLEHGAQAEVPEQWRTPKQTGVGVAKPDKQTELELDT